MVKIYVSLIFDLLFLNTEKESIICLVMRDPGGVDITAAEGNYFQW